MQYPRIVGWPSGALSHALLFALLTAGCAQDAQDDSADPLRAYEGQLITEMWVHCANRGEFCSFNGTRKVRYGQNTTYRTISATGGIACRPNNFGANRNTAGHCEVLTVVTSTAGSAGGPLGGAGAGAGGMGAAGTSAAGTGAAGTDHSMHTGGTSGSTGPFIDASAIPAGDPGSSGPKLGRTTEKPGASDGTGAFRTVCNYSHMNFDDPIVYPGQPGKAHLHAYFGNTLANAYSTPESLRTTGNSTCRGGTVNRTGYWVPALIDATGKPIKPQSLETYYKTGYNGIAPSAIRPFPSGLRMIAGDAKSTAAQRIAYWGCRNNYIGHPGSIPNCTAGDSVTLTVEFPQCWDGVNLDSSDHKSHMAYPRSGACPATHPVPIPAITMNVMYPNPTGSSAGWRLASDMYEASKPAGYSAHADWMEAWDPEIVQAFVTNCLNAAVDCKSHLVGDGRTMN